MCGHGTDLDEFWTGHPFAQANLYAYGRLCWDPTLDPGAVLDEWVDLTFPGAPDAVRQALHAVLDRSWETYEQYTSPLGVGFMVSDTNSTSTTATIATRR